jgi:adenine-specific DNA-methyltransferase
VSRLNDLLRQVAKADPQLAKDLQRETDALAERRAFGLNFERHVPEAVELPGRPVRKSDKVRILPARGTMPTKADERLYRVTRTYTEDGDAMAEVEALDNPDEVRAVAVGDLVVVAEFRDPIYPGLVSTGKVERGGDKPFHTVINAENYHALQALLFTHRGKVDCIYIDPPYNTGARDWKYNNDYVESDDHYRHSKWLAMMERRLLLAKELLNPADSVLIATIDEKEYLRLGLLLHQTFPDARTTMVCSNINPGGSTRKGTFSRAVEYIFFVQIGSSEVRALPLSEDWDAVKNSTKGDIHWHPLQRTGQSIGNTRVGRPNLFYPVFVQQSPDGPVFHSVGDPIDMQADWRTVPVPPRCKAVWPIRKDGSEGCWGASAPSLRELIERGYARLGQWNGEKTPIYFLQAGMVKKVEDGQFAVTGRRPDGSVTTSAEGYRATFIPEDMWRIGSHDASRHGSNLLAALVPGRKFPFPKSLYAVEDSLRFFVSDKPGAVIVDFFAGSGTTAHAVCRLNKQDGGRRISISVTNNEVGPEEASTLRRNGLRPGDEDWEALGIVEHVTKPRLHAALTGVTHTGAKIPGDYKFTDTFPMSDGFSENVEFFTLTYESAIRVASNRDFRRIAPFLWLRAGSSGRRVDDISSGWDIADTYGVIADLDMTESFLRALRQRDGVGLVFVVTDEDRLFEAVVRQLPVEADPVRLYSSYLRNFEIEAARTAR